MEAASDLLDEVRAACREVAARARAVKIDEGRLPSYADEIGATLETEPPALDPHYHHLGDGTSTLAFVLTLDAVNFGSGYFPHPRKRPGLSGYFTVAASLTERFVAAGPFSALELERLSPADCAALFGQDGRNAPAIELMGLIARALNDLGRFLGERFGGRFEGPVEAAEG